MDDRRIASGFQKLGRAGARGLGLALPRARALSIEVAWRAAAGRSIARRAVVRRLARGVLEIDVSEPAWRAALLPLLPEIEARLARDHPALAIERIRVMDP